MCVQRCIRLDTQAEEKAQHDSYGCEKVARHFHGRTENLAGQHRVHAWAPTTSFSSYKFCKLQATHAVTVANKSVGYKWPLDRRLMCTSLETV